MRTGLAGVGVLVGVVEVMMVTSMPVNKQHFDIQLALHPLVP